MNDIRIKQKRFYKTKMAKLEEEKKSTRLKFEKIITFDIETWGLNPSNLALASFYNGSEFTNFLDKKGILEYLDLIEENTIIFAHNGSRFDINIFFDELMMSTKWTMKKTGEILHFSYINKLGKTIKFKDSYYILQSSLKNLAKDFLSIDNQKLIIDNKFIEPEKNGFKKVDYLENIYKYNLENISEEDIKYCNQDTKVLYDLLHLEEFKKWGFDFINKNTIASISFSKLLENSNELYIDINKDREFLELYRGGITDIYNHKSNNKVLCLDYNSFYPSKMIEKFGNISNMKRVEFSNTYINKNEEEFFDMLKNFPNGYSEVEIKIKENLDNKTILMLKKLPIFPTMGINFFDYTNNETYQISIMNVELENLLPYFEIKPIYALYSPFKDLHTPFKDYIIEMYKNKEEAARNKEQSKKFISKLLLNSSYGRLGLKTQSDGFRVGSYEFIKDFISKELDYSIQREKDQGYTYIWEKENIKTQAFLKLEESYKNKELEGTKPLNFLKKFFEEINNNFDGLTIKSINIIDRKILKEKDTELFIISYKTSKKPSIQSSYYYASEITAKCRAKLIKDMLDIEINTNGKICYTDTDSFHIDTKEPEKILDYLDKKGELDPFKIGLLDNEGIYDKGIWLSKKHYYLFKEIDNKLVLKKEALKGFTTSKILDYFVYEAPVVFVNKIYSRISNATYNTNILLDSKTFLNFTTKRKINNELFTIEEVESGRNLTETLEHSKIIKNLFFNMFDSNYYVEENREDKDNNTIIQITKERIDLRISELKAEYEDKISKGIFFFDIDNYNFASKDIENQLNQLMEKETKPKRQPKTRRKTSLIDKLMKI